MIPLVVGAALVGLGAALSAKRRLGLERDLGVSVVRAVVQLGLVAVAIEAIFEHLGLSALFVAVMLLAAARTSGRRLHVIRRSELLAAWAIAGAAGATLLPLFASGAFETSPRYVIPLAGIVIGGAMKAASLAGLRMVEELDDRRAEIETRLALGDAAHTALLPSIRRATVTALVPAVDQTKNVGIVTLPGAFVGMLLGGASPIDAAQVQLTILFALLGAEALAASLMTGLVARSVIQPGQRISAPVAPRAR